MNESLLKYLKPLTGLIIAIFMVWYFSDIVAYVLIAIIMSMIGTPIMKQLGKIKIRKKPVPRALAAATTLLLMILVIVGIILIFVPLIIKQANLITSIDVDSLTSYYKEPIERINEFLIQYNVLESKETIAQNIQSKLFKLFDLSLFTDFFANLVSATGSVFMGIFIVLFLTYYSIVDSGIWRDIILMLTPEEYVGNMKNILHDSKELLIRYFRGLMLEVIIMMTIESTVLLFFGIPNALLIGFFGGLMNIIPYLGPLIGASLGVVLVILSEISVGNYQELLPSVIIVLAVFAGANLIDNIILQPQIYSKSVKSHPVEVFLAIIFGGRIAGIAGMVLAIPTYTVIKVVARQFMQHMKLVKFLTREM